MRARGVPLATAKGGRDAHARRWARQTLRKSAEESAVFVRDGNKGHDEETARQIVREQGVDQILAAKATLGKGE